jgi:hypothetical protein
MFKCIFISFDNYYFRWIEYTGMHYKMLDDGCGSGERRCSYNIPELHIKWLINNIDTIKSSEWTYR